MSDGELQGSDYIGALNAALGQTISEWSSQGLSGRPAIERFLILRLATDGFAGWGVDPNLSTATLSGINIQAYAANPSQVCN